MFTRTKHRWTTVLQSPDGSQVDYETESYWDPEFEGIAEMVAGAAAAMAWYETKKSTLFAPLAPAIYQGPVEPGVKPEPAEEPVEA